MMWTGAPRTSVQGGSPTCSVKGCTSMLKLNCKNYRGHRSTQIDTDKTLSSISENLRESAAGDSLNASAACAPAGRDACSVPWPSWPCPSTGGTPVARRFTHFSLEKSSELFRDYPNIMPKKLPILAPAHDSARDRFAAHDLLFSAFCILLSAHCLLPSA
jgi:hypothetical protein